MLSLAPAATGLGGLAGGAAGTAPGFAMLGLGATALFAALLGLLLPVGPEEEDGGGESWTSGLDRRAAAVCMLAFAAKSGVAGMIAWQVWEALGPAPALGLVAVALVFLTAALAFGGVALRRR